MKYAKKLAAGLSFLALTACNLTSFEQATTPNAQPDPATLNAQAAAGVPSARSEELMIYYARVQNDLLNRGLLRVDGGGVDTPYYNRDIARNFEKIAFYDEYTQNGGFERSNGARSSLRKWKSPVRVRVEFGASVSANNQIVDRTEVAQYVTRLSRVTQHPISMNAAAPNFYVLVTGEDDRAQLIQRIRQIEPGINTATLQMIQNLPRDIHCVVAAFATKADDYVYTKAIAVIRAEHPALTRKACIHEELAQGLGLANDTPRARPSIFNDDDEFAFLTSHDEELLRLLYNPALAPGMSAEEARPIVAKLLEGRIGPS